MTATTSSYLYLDERLPSNWVVRDAEGIYWIVPSTPNAWEQRQPYDVDELGCLQPVPGHYKQLLGIPDAN